MVIKNPPKISPGLIFGGGGAYYRDDICVKNQGGGLFSGGGAYFRGGGTYYRDFTVYGITVVKLSIISILTPFRPVFNPLEVLGYPSNEYFSVHTVQIYL